MGASAAGYEGGVGRGNSISTTSLTWLRVLQASCVPSRDQSKVVMWPDLKLVSLRGELPSRLCVGNVMARDYVTIREEQRSGEPLWTFSTVRHDRLNGHITRQVLIP